MAPKLSSQERRRIRELARRGATHAEIRAEIGRSAGIIAKLVVEERGGGRAVHLVDWEPGPGRLTLADREEIALALERGESFSAIARRLGRAVSTVSRDVAANGGRGRYRAAKAHRRAWQRARRPKTAKLVSCPRLQSTVAAWLEELWSPTQITRRLRAEFPEIR